MTRAVEGGSKWERWGAALTLMVLAPVIAEVESGATRLSFIFVLLPEIMVWGCGALIIRELVRRWGAGWTSMWLLALGLSVAEEFVIQQTSLAPLPWVAAPAYGRVWGVNLIYFVFMLGFESVLVVMVPVELTELIFPARRERPWLKNGGLVMASLVFLVGSLLAWFMWVKIARVKVLRVEAYQPPLGMIVAGVMGILVLGIAAYGLRKLGSVRTTRRTPSMWTVGLVTMVFGFPWYVLMMLIFAPRRDVAVWIAVLVAVFWAGAGFLVARRFTFSERWSEMESWAGVFAATLVGMIAGFSGSGSWSRKDLMAKVVLNLVTVAAMMWLGTRVARRNDERAG